MAKHSPLKRVGAVMLTLAMLVGMMSVMGAFSFAASAEEVTKFVANFQEGLNRNDLAWQNGEGANDQVLLSDPTAEGASDAVKAMHAWMDSKFNSYKAHTGYSKRSYFGQGCESGCYFAYGQRAYRVNGRALVFINQEPGGEVFWSTSTLVPKHEGKEIEVKNFEATVKFVMANSYSGGILFSFHESEAGKQTYADSYTTKVVTGSTLAIGNNVDAKASYGQSGTSTDAWKFYGDGKVETNYMTNVDKVFDKNLDDQWYTLTVKAVNGTATFTMANAAGDVIGSMEKAYTTTSGKISIGLTSREILLKEITVTELDSNGQEVNIGSYNNCLAGTHVYGEYVYDNNATMDANGTKTATCIVCGHRNTIEAEGTKLKKAFVANFPKGLDANAEFQWAGGVNYHSFLNNPEAEGASDKLKNAHAWMSEHFDSYMCMDSKDYANFTPRSYFGQNDSKNNYFYYAQRGEVGSTGSDRGLVYHDATSDGETFWHINTLVPKADGETLNVKNFEATVKFAFMTSNTTGGVLFAFHEANPGKYIYNWNYSERYNSGSVLAIGNAVDAKTAGNDAWKFFDKGAVLEDEYLYGVENFGKTLSGQYYTLTVKAVNGTATFTLTSKDGAFSETMTTTYTSTEGGISFGVSGRQAIINEITVKELDANGEQVDLGAYKACLAGTHIYGEYTYNNDATIKADGTKTAACLVCGHENTITAEGTKIAGFFANFAEGLNRADQVWQNGEMANDQVVLSDPNAEGATEAVKAAHAWLDGKFNSYMSHTAYAKRTYFGEKDSNGSTFAYGQRAYRVNGRALILLSAEAGGELFWGVNSLVPKTSDGQEIVVKNFEATVKFVMANSYSGGILFSFHESEAGKQTYANNYATKVVTGSTLAIGNNVDAKAGYGQAGTSKDAWKFYGDGNVEVNYMTNVDKVFDKNLDDQWYTLTVRAVNGTATFTITDAAGAVVGTMEKTYTTTSGKISLGLTSREILVSEFAIAELDKKGNVVPLGTFVNNPEQEWIEGLPEFGKYTGVNGGYFGTKTYVFDNTDAAAYNAYLASVEEAGWVKVSDNEAADNLFATYQKDGKTVYIYYLAAENRVHVVDMEANAVLPTAAAAYTKVCEPLFTQVQLSYAVASEGMSYLVRLSDGRFIVIDGGTEEADYLESKHLYNLMKEQNVLDKITVAAWIVTHAHQDHEDVPVQFMSYYSADDLTIEQVVFNYPTRVSTPSRTEQLVAAINTWGAQRVTPYIGQEFNYADAKIEILHTIDAYAPGQIDGEDFNNTSVVFSIELGGQKIMITGDMHTIGNDQLVKLYGSYLKSDIAQWAHHALGGATRELYEAIDPAVIVLPASVFHHTNTFNHYRFFAADDDRTGISFKWLYYPQYHATNHVKEVFVAGFKEVTFELPYFSAEGCEYMPNRNNNGYVFEEAAENDATVPNPFYELNVGDATNTVYYKDEAYEVPSIRVEKGAAVQSYNVAGLSDVLNGNNSFEMFVAIDTLPDSLSAETFYMFGTSSMGLTLENNTLNVSLRRGDNTAVLTNGGRYYRGGVVGGKVVNHIVGTYDAATNTLAVYKNGVLITTQQYEKGFTADDVLNLGSTGFNGKSGYTVLGARVYDEALSADQVAATYWNAIEEMTHVCDFNIPKYDDANHWDECECGEKANVTPHDAVTTHDDTHHWDACLCGYTTEKVEHEWETKSDDNKHWTECDCGAKGEEIAHDCKVKFDEDGHWTACDCGYATDKVGHTMNAEFDENGEWAECDCGYKTDVIDHQLVGANDDEYHWTTCACGYESEKVAHEYEDGFCDCGHEQENVAIINPANNEIIVKPAAGFELKAGSLLVKDGNGNYFVPERVGFREGGDADTYVVNDPRFNPVGATVEYEFIEVTLDNPNIGNIGNSVNEEVGGLRFVSRFARKVEAGVEYVVLSDGTKYEIVDYGMLISSQPGLDTTDASDEEDMVVDSANKYVSKQSILAAGKYYDVCDDYIDMSVCITGIDKLKGYDNPEELDIYARAYVVVKVDAETTRVLYGNIFSCAYADVV